jgi:hypothetical protein
MFRHDACTRKPLRDVRFEKLPFAEYSVARPPARRARRWVRSVKRLSGTIPPPRLGATVGKHTSLAPRSSHRERRGEPQAASLPVVIGSGLHPFPFRTRKLSLIPPMVLHGKLCGRVGRCRHYSSKPVVSNRNGLLVLYAGPEPSTHSVPCAAWAIFFEPPRTRGGGVWESRSLPALFVEARCEKSQRAFLSYAGS